MRMRWTRCGFWLPGALAVALALPADEAAAADPLSGAALFDDVARYAGFGVHRYGSAGERAAMDWIGAELANAGFRVQSQPLTMARQYELSEATVRVGGTTLAAFPHWWLPLDRASFDLTATLADGPGAARASERSGAPTTSGAGDAADASGQLVWLSLPFDRAAYLNEAHRQAIAKAAARKPLAILLTIDNPGDEIYTYNANQEDAPWPVPVIVVAAAHKPLLADAVARRTPVAIHVAGRYLRDQPGRNVIGRLDRGAARTIVVSTPVTSWFVSACERGPGIANFLALARVAAARRLDANFVFVATAGHEIGHGGMEAFLAERAPPPAAVTAWIHLGASNACHLWQRDGAGWRHDGTVDASSRLLVVSPSLQAMVAEQFRDVPARTFVADKVGVGELREVKAAGYPAFFGMAGTHRFFHTPADEPTGTSASILEPVARAFARALEALAPPMK